MHAYCVYLSINSFLATSLANKRLGRLPDWNRGPVCFSEHCYSSKPNHYCRARGEHEVWPPQPDPVWTFTLGKLWAAQRVGRDAGGWHYWQMVYGTPRLYGAHVSWGSIWPQQTCAQAFLIEGLRAALKFLILIRTNFSHLIRGGKMIPTRAPGLETRIGARGGAILFASSNLEYLIYNDLVSHHFYLVQLPDTLK